MVMHAPDTTQCSLLPMTAALYKAPKSPFFSDRNISRSLGTVQMYAHVQMMRRTATTSPSK